MRFGPRDVAHCSCRATSPAADYLRSDCVEKVVNEFGVARHPRQQRRVPEEQESIEEIRLRAARPHLSHEIYGYFYMAKAAVPRMKKGACIINTGSITGLEGEKTLLDYCGDQGRDPRLHQIARAESRRERDSRERVAPGPVWTPLNTQAKPPKKFRNLAPTWQWVGPAQPEELAPAYVFLASNIDSSSCRGVILPVLGGDTISG